MRRAADMRYSQHLVIYCQISGRVMDLRFVLSVEAELLTPRTAAGLPVHSHHFSGATLMLMWLCSQLEQLACLAEN